MKRKRKTDFIFSSKESQIDLGLILLPLSMVTKKKWNIFLLPLSMATKMKWNIFFV